MESLIVEVLLPAGMVGLMCGMGLSLSAEDFRRVAETPRASLLGTGLQLLVVPLIGLGIALGFGLPRPLAAGLVIIAACPGGLFSNVFVHVARANTALSITLTAGATAVTLFTLPLWVQAILLATDDAGSALSMPLLQTALDLGGLTVLPIALGMGVRSRWPAAASYERWLTRIGVVVISFAFVWDALHREEIPIVLLQQAIFPVVCLIAASGVIGLGAPRVLGLSTRDSVTIGVEVVVKNTLLGLVVARGSLGFDATLPVLAFASIQVPLGVGLLAAWRRFDSGSSLSSADGTPA